MKFKSIFLGMLGAAALVSCNNEEGISPKPEPEVVEGLPVYATVSIGLAGDTKTYAGTDDVAASTQERTVKDLAMYIYKADASGAVPECAIYCTSVPTTNLVTMKTTSGAKKIYVAANPMSNAAGLALTTTTGFSGVSAAMQSATLFPILNNTIDATASGVALNTPAAGHTKADGLIKNLAMNDLYGKGNASTGVEENQYSGGSSQAPLMTNWETTDDVATSSTHSASADFTLKPDVDSVASETHADNHVTINVQRAYAKISMRFSVAAAPSGAVTGCSTSGYTAATGQPQEGRFYPWGSGTNGYWSLGNIPTSTRPFQTFTAGHIRDQWATATNDSILSGFSNWVAHYDNNRIYPAAKLTTYPMPNITVTDVKGNMTATGNYTNLSSPTVANSFAYCPESAREHPVMKGHQTYVVTGGVYRVC